MELCEFPHPTVLSGTFGSTVRSCLTFLLCGPLTLPRSKKCRQLRTVEPKVVESDVGCGLVVLEGSLGGVSFFPEVMVLPLEIAVLKVQKPKFFWPPKAAENFAYL